MKKMLPILLLIVSMVFSLDQINTTYTAVPGASVSSSGWNSVKDTLKNGINRVIDTVNLIHDTASAALDTAQMALDTAQLAVDSTQAHTALLSAHTDSIAAHKATLDDLVDSATGFSSDISAINDTLDKHADTINYYKTHGLADSTKKVPDSLMVKRIQVSADPQLVIQDNGSDAFTISLAGTDYLTRAIRIGRADSATDVIVTGNVTLYKNLTLPGGNVQTQIDTKLNRANFDDSMAIYNTGTAGQFAVSSGSGKTKTVSAVDSTEFKYLDGVTSAIQTQINSKLNNANFDDSLNNHLIILDTTFYDSLYDGATYRSRIMARVVRHGNKISLRQPPLTGGITATTTTSLKGIPSAFLPTTDTITVVCKLVESDTTINGSALIHSGGIDLVDENGRYLRSGIGGIAYRRENPSVIYNSVMLEWVK